MSYRISVTPIIPDSDLTAMTATQVTAITNPEPIFSTIVESVDLARLSALLLTPARAKRSDLGKSRKKVEPQLI